jgi:putative ABC transport system ATP-binding protein
VLTLSHIGKSYRGGELAVEALRDVSLDIAGGDYVAITGPSGSGKSTLMNILGCLDVPDTGRYVLDGKCTAACGAEELAVIRNRTLGFVFQGFCLQARATALQNVAQPLIYRGTPRRERDGAARQLLARVGLADRLQHLPGQLSGGQRQRVAIARALVTRPAVLLADEPTGNLDSSASADILDLVGELHRSGMTIVVVTHNEEVARRAARRVRVLDGRIDG